MLSFLYGIYMLKCDVIVDDDVTALMVDASNILVIFLPNLYDFLQQLLILLFC